MMTGWLRAHQVVAVATVVALAGCTGATGGTKAGGQAAPVVLRIGTDDFLGRPAADQIEEFARQVKELSGGTVRIQPLWNAAGDTGDDDWDQKVARLVVAGELDMGLIPARAWDTEGVTTLRALNAPFLITSDKLAAEVASSELAGSMLAGLDPVGVTGLALLPEGLRHVFSFGEPLLTPGDFKGELVRVSASDTTYATFAALGATPDDVTANFDAISNGQVAAAESSYAGASGLAEPSTGVSNVTLFPKYNSLVINTAAWAELPTEQQAALRKAAQRTRGWSIDTLPDEASAAAAFCRAGGRVVTAKGQYVAALQRAVQPVYTELEQDPTTRALIEQIRALQESTGAEPATVEPCGPDSVAPSAAAGGESAAFPEGVYRARVPTEVFLEAGVNEADANYHAGVWTLIFAAGRLTVTDINHSTGQKHTDTGTYCVKDGRIGLGLAAFAKEGSDAPCDPFWDAGWTVDGDQLRFTDVRAEGTYPLLVATIFGSRPFTRIG